MWFAHFPGILCSSLDPSILPSRVVHQTGTIPDTTSLRLPGRPAAPDRPPFSTPGRFSVVQSPVPDRSCLGMELVQPLQAKPTPDARHNQRAQHEFGSRSHVVGANGSNAYGSPPRWFPTGKRPRSLYIVPAGLISAGGLGFRV